MRKIFRMQNPRKEVAAHTALREAINIVNIAIHNPAVKRELVRYTNIDLTTLSGDQAYDHMMSMGRTVDVHTYHPKGVQRLHQHHISYNSGNQLFFNINALNRLSVPSICDLLVQEYVENCSKYSSITFGRSKKYRTLTSYQNTAPFIIGDVVARLVGQMNTHNVINVEF